MSLLSQRDREVVIRALEIYLADAGTTEYYLGELRHSAAEINSLLQWVRLEHQKHANR